MNFGIRLQILIVALALGAGNAHVIKRRQAAVEPNNFEGDDAIADNEIIPQTISQKYIIPPVPTPELKSDAVDSDDDAVYDRVQFDASAVARASSEVAVLASDDTVPTVTNEQQSIASAVPVAKPVDELEASGMPAISEIAATIDETVAAAPASAPTTTNNEPIINKDTISNNLAAATATDSTSIGIPNDDNTNDNTNDNASLEPTTTNTQTVSNQNVDNDKVVSNVEQSAPLVVETEQENVSIVDNNAETAETMDNNGTPVESISTNTDTLPTSTETVFAESTQTPIVPSGSTIAPRPTQQTPAPTTNRPWFTNFLPSNLVDLFFRPFNFTTPSFSLQTPFAPLAAAILPNRTATPASSQPGQTLFGLGFLVMPNGNISNIFRRPWANLQRETAIRHDQPVGSDLSARTKQDPKFLNATQQFAQTFGVQSGGAKPWNYTQFMRTHGKSGVLHIFLPLQQFQPVGAQAEQTAKSDDVTPTPGSMQTVDNKLSWQILNVDRVMGSFFGQQQQQQQSQAIVNLPTERAEILGNEGSTANANGTDSGRQKPISSVLLELEVPNPILQLVKTFLNIFTP